MQRFGFTSHITLSGVALCLTDCKPGSEDGRMSVDGTNTGRHRDKEVY